MKEYEHQEKQTIKVKAQEKMYYPGKRPQTVRSRDSKEKCGKGDT
jgi:hypothetical protein